MLGSIIKEVPYINLLGIPVDRNLLWKKQLKEITLEIGQCLYVSKKLNEELHLYIITEEYLSCLDSFSYNTFAPKIGWFEVSQDLHEA